MHAALPDNTLHRDIALDTCNTLALPCRAAAYARLTDADAAPALCAEAARQLGPTAPRFILGGGSNLVLPEHYPGLILHAALPGKRLRSEDADAWYVSAAAGENWHDFVDWTLTQGYPGLENLALIPGTVGAAPVQNIGAYGREAGDFIERIDGIDLAEHLQKNWDHAGAGFSYRNSVFKREGWHLDGRMLITQVHFRLPKRWQANTRYGEVQAELAAMQVDAPTPRDVFNAIVRIRRRKLPDPAVLPNAGSFFENPVVEAAQADALKAAWPTLPVYPQADGRAKLAAGWLIEQAGWKGRDLGPVGMYEKQALVLVNKGGGALAHVAALTDAVQQAVQTRFGVRLHREPITPRLS